MIALQISKHIFPKLQDLRLIDSDIDPLISSITEEIARRKIRFQEKVRRKKLVSEEYSPLHPELFHLQEDFLHPHFVELVQCSRNTRDSNSLPHLTTISEEKRLYTFPVFKESFVQLLNEELKNFEESHLQKGRPNSMNRYGISLDELGLDEFLLSPLRENYLDSLSRLCYPEWTGQRTPYLDSQRAFTVQYRPDQDKELHYHYDNAEVTLNVSLSEGFSGGELYFGDTASDAPVTSSCRLLTPLRPGQGLLHRGRQMHGALPLRQGCRQNLILWMRSSRVRNTSCPMCGNRPDLLPAPEGSSGDGFTSGEDVVSDSETRRCNLA